MRLCSILFTALIVLYSSSWVRVCADEPGKFLSQAQRAKNIKSFETVWKTVNDKHWDEDLGGVDWKKVYREFAPKVKKANSQKEVRELLSAMLGRLGKSHYGIVPAEVYEELADANEKQKDGVPGFDLRIVDGKPIVFRVPTDSPAFKAGVRPGWELISADKFVFDPLLAKIAKSFDESPQLQLKQVRAVMAKLAGPIGEKLAMEFKNGKGKTKKVAVELIKPAGKVSQFGDLPAMYVAHESKTLPGNIGYFSLNVFADPVYVMPAFQKTLMKHMKGKGFIIDLRGNPGGIGMMAAGLGNWFVQNDKQRLGTMVTRNGKLNFLLYPRPETFEGPLAILVDELSASTSEILAGGMQDLGRARIFGTRTAAAALPSVFVRLPNGDGFQYAIANYVSVGGKALEGRGVIPDQRVPLTQEELLRGEDPVLNAAVAWIESQQESEK